MSTESRIVTAATEIFDWLRAADEVSAQVDAVIGFGHFDLRIPDACGRWASSGIAQRIIFTGGIGAGTANLPGPEADVFRAELERRYPKIDASRCVTENRSTNTAENIQLTRTVLDKLGPAWALGTGIKSALLIAHPARLRRVRQTWALLAPDVPAWAIAPATDYATDDRLHRENGSSLLTQVVGELQRLLEYPGKGWIAPIALPDSIHQRYSEARAVTS